MKDKIEILKAYALAHYSEGGDWVYETHTDKDYEDMLVTSGNLETAKANLKEYWELMHEREQEIQSLAF